MSASELEALLADLRRAHEHLVRTLLDLERLSSAWEVLELRRCERALHAGSPWQFLRTPSPAAREWAEYANLDWSLWFRSGIADRHASEESQHEAESVSLADGVIGTPLPESEGVFAVSAAPAQLAATAIVRMPSVKGARAESQRLGTPRRPRRERRR